MTASSPVRFAEDMHVPVPVEAGWGYMREAVAAARRRGLRRIGVVAEGGRDDLWVRDFVRAAKGAAVEHDLEVLTALEVQMMDVEGGLSLPPGHLEVDYLLVSDAVLPTRSGGLGPLAIREKLCEGEMSASHLLRRLPELLVKVMHRYPGVVFTRPFSLLQRVGVRETWLGTEALRRLSRVARATRCGFELNERWQCPGPEALRIFQSLRVRILIGTEAHDVSGIGRYDYVPRALPRGAPLSEAASTADGFGEGSRRAV